MPASVDAVLRRAAREESVVLSDLVQTAGAAIIVGASSTAGFLSLGLIVAADAPSREGHGFSTLAHDGEGKDGDDEERGDLVKSHLIHRWGGERRLLVWNSYERVCFDMFGVEMDSVLCLCDVLVTCDEE